MARRGSSSRWLQEHHGDPYVQEAKRLGYRSRAVFKLMDIDRRDRILAPGQCVVDLGAAPGGWSQVAAQAVGSGGRVLALDLLAIDPLPGVECLQLDFTEAEALTELRRRLGQSPVDLVLSDMAPNISGVRVADQARAMLLAELALEFAAGTLNAGGGFVVKVFQGDGFDAYLRQLRGLFRSVATRKPPASRDRSRELYLVARGRRV